MRVLNSATADLADRPVRRFQHPFKSQFLRHNAVFMVGALSVGFLNYLFYPIMGRILNPAAFGEVQVLFSLFAQITIFLNVLSLITVGIVANYSDRKKRNQVVRELEKLAVASSLTLAIIAAFLSPTLGSFFHFSHTWPFTLLAIAVLAGTPLAFRSGFLRGQKKFGLVTTVSLLASVGNICFSILLAASGFGSAGVMIGLATGQFSAFILAAYFARRNGLNTTPEEPATQKPRPTSLFQRQTIDFKLIAPELRYASLVLIGSLCVTSLYTLDTIVAKHYFDAHTAGLYAGIATVARIIFFATASVLQVMLPSIKLSALPAENRRMLGKSLLLLTVAGGVPLLVFTLFPSQVISLLMGAQYSVYAHLLPWLGFAMLIIAIFNLLIMYHIALRRYAAGIIAVIGIVSTYFLIILNHQTPGQVVACICFGSALSLVVLGAWSGSQMIKNSRMRTQEGGVNL